MSRTVSSSDEADACPGCESDLFVVGSSSPAYEWRCHASWCHVARFNTGGTTEVERR